MAHTSTLVSNLTALRASFSTISASLSLSLPLHSLLPPISLSDLARLSLSARRAPATRASVATGGHRGWRRVRVPSIRVLRLSVLMCVTKCYNVVQGNRSVMWVWDRSFFFRHPTRPSTRPPYPTTHPTTPCGHPCHALHRFDPLRPSTHTALSTVLATQSWLVLFALGAKRWIRVIRLFDPLPLSIRLLA